jgi:hypothetical protein
MGEGCYWRTKKLYAIVIGGSISWGNLAMAVSGAVLQSNIQCGSFGGSS